MKRYLYATDEVMTIINKVSQGYDLSYPSDIEKFAEDFGLIYYRDDMDNYNIKLDGKDEDSYNEYCEIG